ncbi:hypothetical protein MSPP1_004064 [Malassezia sp. CBS 17886]|nr:hypothetical protein MSPP1_004064 [Malassezia sp. CBS 17886]
MADPPDAVYPYAHSAQGARVPPDKVTQWMQSAETVQPQDGSSAWHMEQPAAYMPAPSRRAAPMYPEAAYGGGDAYATDPTHQHMSPALHPRAYDAGDAYGTAYAHAHAPPAHSYAPHEAQDEYVDYEMEPYSPHAQFAASPVAGHWEFVPASPRGLEARAPGGMASFSAPVSPHAVPPPIIRASPHGYAPGLAAPGPSAALGVPAPHGTRTSALGVSTSPRGAAASPHTMAASQRSPAWPHQDAISPSDLSAPTGSPGAAAAPDAPQPPTSDASVRSPRAARHAMRRSPQTRKHSAAQYFDSLATPTEAERQQQLDPPSPPPETDSAPRTPRAAPLTPMQEAVVAQFSGADIADHTCAGTPRCVFVGAVARLAGQVPRACYAVHFVAHELADEAAFPRPPARRRGTLSALALSRRAQLHGTVAALRAVLAGAPRRQCVHLCISSAYVAKAWGTWIPLWEAHGWPGGGAHPRALSPALPGGGRRPGALSPTPSTGGRPGALSPTPSAGGRPGAHSPALSPTPPAGRRGKLPRSPNLDTPTTPRMLARRNTHLSESDSVEVASSLDSPAGTDASPSVSGRGPSRRLVDEDLLRELAALRAKSAALERAGTLLVHLYLIERPHNPGESLAKEALDDAERMQGARRGSNDAADARDGGGRPWDARDGGGYAMDAYAYDGRPWDARANDGRPWDARAADISPRDARAADIPPRDTRTSDVPPLAPTANGNDPFMARVPPLSPRLRAARSAPNLRALMRQDAARPPVDAPALPRTARTGRGGAETPTRAQDDAAWMRRPRAAESDLARADDAAPARRPPRGVPPTAQKPILRGAHADSALALTDPLPSPPLLPATTVAPPSPSPSLRAGKARLHSTFAKMRLGSRMSRRSSDGNDASSVHVARADDSAPASDAGTCSPTDAPSVDAPRSMADRGASAADPGQPRLTAEALRELDRQTEEDKDKKRWSKRFPGRRAMTTRSGARSESGLSLIARMTPKRFRAKESDAGGALGGRERGSDSPAPRVDSAGRDAEEPMPARAGAPRKQPAAERPPPAPRSACGAPARASLNALGISVGDARDDDDDALHADAALLRSPRGAARGARGGGAASPCFSAARVPVGAPPRSSPRLRDQDALAADARDSLDGPPSDDDQEWVWRTARRPRAGRAGGDDGGSSCGARTATVTILRRPPPDPFAAGSGTSSLLPDPSPRLRQSDAAARPRAYSSRGAQYLPRRASDGSA